MSKIERKGQFWRKWNERERDIRRKQRNRETERKRETERQLVSGIFHPQWTKKQSEELFCLFSILSEAERIWKMFPLGGPCF